MVNILCMTSSGERQHEGNFVLLVLFFHDKEELFTSCVCEAVVQEKDLSELSLLNCTYSGTLIS